jgi:hypothetical protein
VTSYARVSTTPRLAGPAILLALALLGASVLLVQPATAAADGPVALGTAESFAVLAGTGITNTGATTINGDVGTFPTTTRTGFGTVTQTGTDHGGDSVTQGAKDSLVTAYDDAAGRLPATSIPVELGGSTLLAGVYKSGTFGLTGTLTLDAAGNADAQFVFQMESTLIAEVNSRVVMLNGADPCNVVWQVGSSATFKTGSRFTGDVLALTSITAQRTATFRGRLLARNGAVTLDTNTITNAACGAAIVPEESLTPTPTPTPSPVAVVTPTTPPVAVPRLAVPVVTAGGPATPAAPGTPGRIGGGPPARPFLPHTGLPGWVTVTGFALLAAGCAALAAGRVTGRHETAR